MPLPFLSLNSQCAHSKCCIIWQVGKTPFTKNIISRGKNHPFSLPLIDHQVSTVSKNYDMHCKYLQWKYKFYLCPFFPLYFNCSLAQFGIDVDANYADLRVLDYQKYSKTTGENGVQEKPVLLKAKIFTV